MSPTMDSRNGTQDKDTNGHKLPSIWHIMNDVPASGARGLGVDLRQSNGIGLVGISGPAGISGPIQSPIPARPGSLPPLREQPGYPYDTAGHAIVPHHSPGQPFPQAATTFSNRNLPDVQRLEVRRSSVPPSPNGMQQAAEVFQPGPRPAPTHTPLFLNRQHVQGVGLCYVYDDGSYLPCEIDGEAVNPEWRTTKQGKARKRLPQACDRCRDKKVRCENGNPCKKCVKLDEACTWSTSTRSNRRSSPASAGSCPGRPAAPARRQVPVPVTKSESHSPVKLVEHAKQENEPIGGSFILEVRKPAVAGPFTLPRPLVHSRRGSESSFTEMELDRRKRPRIWDEVPRDILTGWREPTVLNGSISHSNSNGAVNGHGRSHEPSSSRTSLSTQAAEVNGFGPEPRHRLILELPELLNASGDREKHELLSVEDFVRWTNESIAASSESEIAWFTAIAFGAAYGGTVELKSLANTLTKKWKKCEKAADLVEEINHTRKLKAEAEAEAERARQRAEAKGLAT